MAKIVKPNSAPKAVAVAVPAWDKLAVLACGGVGIATVLALVTLNPDPTDAQWKTYWAVLALTVACIGALLPDFLEIR